jgi:hypothetical protein
MVEPIDSPVRPPPDSKPLPARPVLTAPLTVPSEALNNPDDLVWDELTDDCREGVDFPTTESEFRVLPADETDCEVESLEQTRESTRYRPVSSEHPMNDAALEQPIPLVAAPTEMGEKSATHPPAPPPPKLLVLRGLRIGIEYPIYEGRNSIGRFADKPVDIDMLSQESVEQIWCSRQHAAITLNKGNIFIEDLNSLNGTWVNGARVHASQPRQLKPGDIVQVGTVQMKLVVG